MRGNVWWGKGGENIYNPENGEKNPLNITSHFLKVFSLPSGAMRPGGEGHGLWSQISWVLILTVIY